MNKKRISFFHIFIFVLMAAFFLIGCGDASSSGKAADSGQPEQKNPSRKDSGKKRESIQEFLLPQASGAVVYGNDFISIDASNIGEGYVMLQYLGDAEKVKMQITIPGGTQYTYTLTLNGSYETFPLTGGDGAYHIDVLENAYDDMYALAFAQDLEVALTDEFKPFLYPNQYAWYTQESKAASYGLELSQESSDDLDYVEHVYRYVIDNIVYDEELAANMPPGYIPDVDRTMETKKGVCFDYASLMTAMLRCQGVPTKLEVGYSGEAYHAWIDVYLKESGWVDKIIKFDGNSWTLMDPTLAAANNRTSVGKYIGDGSNYTVKYSY